MAPLNFSFKEISELEELIKKQPRSGLKKSNEQSVPKMEESDRNGSLDNLTEVRKEEQKVDASETILVNLNIKSGEQGKGKKKKAVAAEVVKSKKTIKFVEYTNAIILHNNTISSLEGIANVLNLIVPEPDFLLSRPRIDLIQWLDLSFNHLTFIHEDIAKLPFLKIFYAHANYFNSIDDIAALAKCPCLFNLTLHGNPIEQIKGYRYFIISMMPALNKFDFTLVSEKELDIVHHKAAHFGEKRMKDGTTIYPELDERYKRLPVKIQEEKMEDKEQY